MDRRGHSTWTEGDMIHGQGGDIIHGQEGTCYIDNWGHDTWRGREMMHGKKEA